MTTTLKLDPAAIRALEERLRDRRFEFRNLDHAHFQARGEEVVVSAYRSGKVVVQGKGAEAFLATQGFGATEAPALAEVVAGSDESGKGDYFGPLVVAAVVVAPDRVEALQRAGVRDCKRMADGAILRAARAIRELCPHAVHALTPPEYNERHKAEGNVALFLSTMHAEALFEAIREAGGCDRVVIDKFTSTARLEEALEKAGVEAALEIRPRAEDNPAVAAASVVARAEFLLGLQALSSEHGVNFPKGAGPAVDSCARRLFQQSGMAELSQVAKTHFKTTQKISGLF